MVQKTDSFEIQVAILSHGALRLHAAAGIASVGVRNHRALELSEAGAIIAVCEDCLDADGPWNKNNIQYLEDPV